jgi:hypothetical protein
VLLDVPNDASDDVSAIAEQIPDPDTLRAGTLVVILGDVARDQSWVGRLFHGTRVLRSIRSSALLSRGYVRLGAGTDPQSGQDLAWGYVS